MTRHHAHVPSSAILLIVGAVACFSVSDTISKTLASRYPIPLLVWARWGAQVVAMLIWLAPSMGFTMVHTRQLRMQLVRGVLLIVSSLCFIAALRYLPLADATALNYLTPTIVIVIAIAFLGERLTLARGAFVFAGLAGMLMIVQPGADIFNAMVKGMPVKLHGAPRRCGHGQAEAGNVGEGASCHARVDVYGPRHCSENTMTPPSQV